jgi:hypothetical protein
MPFPVSTATAGYLLTIFNKLEMANSTKENSACPRAASCEEAV